MRPAPLALLLVAALSGAAGRSQAYDLSEIDGDQAHGNAPILLGWDPARFPLAFRVDPVAPAALPDGGALLGAVRSAFRSWEAASQGTVAFRDEPPPGGGISAPDLAASIGGTDCNTPSDCVHFLATVTSDWSGLTGTGGGVIALTLVKFDTQSRRILDADMLLDNEFHVFDTNGTATRFDTEGIVAHELGHCLGVAHPGSASRATSTMWAVTPPGNVMLRSLEEDDANAVRYLYAPLQVPVPGPDNNFLGLLLRAGGGSVGAGDGGGGTGCILVAGGGGGLSLPVAVLLGLALARLGLRRRG